MDVRRIAPAVAVAGLLAAREASADEPPPAPAPSADAQTAARLERAERRLAALEDERSKLQVSGYVQVDWTVHRQSSQDEVDPATGEPLNEDRFLLRRSRIRVTKDHGLLHGALELDANTVRGPQVRPINAEASIKWPAERPYPNPMAPPDRFDRGPFFLVTAGLFRTPFGFEATEGARQRPWLERTTAANALFPGSFDLGLRVLGGFGFVRYALGVMNGDPIGERTFPGRDPDKSKDLVFRVGTETEVIEGLEIEAGFSGLTGRGFHAGTPPTKDQVVWRDFNEDAAVQPNELQVVTGAPASPSAGFSRFALGADARVHVKIPVLGELTLRAEIVRAKNLDRGLFVADPIAASRDLRELGWHVGASQEITRWAVVAVRHDVYDPDADAREQRAFALVPRDARFSTWSFAVVGRLPHGRLFAQYDLRKNPLGRDASGASTTLADDAFTIRAEVSF